VSLGCQASQDQASIYIYRGQGTLDHVIVTTKAPLNRINCMIERYAVDLDMVENDKLWAVHTEKSYVCLCVSSVCERSTCPLEGGSEVRTHGKKALLMSLQVRRRICARIYKTTTK
jgi:hypothetical protein